MHGKIYNWLIAQLIMQLHVYVRNLILKIKTCFPVSQLCITMPLSCCTQDNVPQVGHDYNVYYIVAHIQ